MAEKNSEVLIREMHGDIKVLGAEMKSAAKAREYIRKEVEDVKAQLQDHQKVLEGHRQEVTKVKTAFGVITSIFGAIWAGALVLLKWVAGE